MKSPYPPIVFFDLEGTLLQKRFDLDKGLVAPSAWQVLAHALGEECLREEEETQRQWNEGKYPGYVEWMRDTIRIHQKYGLTRQTFEAVMNSVQMHAGVPETVEELRRYGVTTAIISGAFKALGDRVQRELKIDHSFCACEYFFDDATGAIDHFNLLPSDVEGKVDFMKLIVKEHGAAAAHCAFVGDGKNDVALAQAVGVSIAFNAQPELQRVCTHLINQERGQEDFSEVLRILRGVGP